jgi:thioester reductase-like protein
MKMQNTGNRTVFLTGATGLVGSNLISPILNLDDSTRIICLIRANSDSEAESRLYSSLSNIKNHKSAREIGSRIWAIHGDITLENLGISDMQYAMLTSEITHIVHCAASVQFNLPIRCARDVNLNGTKYVADLARKAYKSGILRQFSYLGTAYVSGDREGTIYEEELNRGQNFSNTYEQTKFETENYIRQIMGELPINIFRPGIIVGDSIAGITTTFNVLYPVLKMIQHGLVKIIPGSPEITLDILPVDYVCDALSQIIFNSRDGLGHTYHIVAGKQYAPTIGEIAHLVIDYYNHALAGLNLPEIVFISKLFLTANSEYLNNRDFRILSAMRDYESYLTVQRAFDNSNTRRALLDINTTIPEFKDYYKAILNYCLQSCWGKKMKTAA